MSLVRWGCLLGVAVISASFSTVGCGSATLKPGAGGGDGAVVGAGGTTGAGGSAGAGSDGDAGIDSGAGAVDALPTCVGGTTCSVTFASDSTWPAYDDDPAKPATHSLGFARTVCLNAGAPPNCPAGALLYGSGAGWAFSLASIPGAFWIWIPGIMPTDTADLSKVYLSRTFSLGLAPSGQISIAADDAARVVVNGADVGGVGSITDVNQAALSNTRLTTIDVSVALHPGTNTITIAAQNGPASYAGCTPSCTYQTNPGGVVFGGTLSYH